MSSSAAPTAFARDVLRRFGRNHKASAVVEFALVAPVFFALLFAILETALMFFAGQVLETITEASARQIQTGQAQLANYPDSAHFRSAVVCPLIPAIFNCNNIYINVQSNAAASGVNFINPINSGNFVTSGLAYNPGGSCDVVVVQLFYQWQLFVTGLGYNISNLNGNQYLLSATAAFRNEPYSGACAT